METKNNQYNNGAVIYKTKIKKLSGIKILGHILENDGLPYPNFLKDFKKFTKKFGVFENIEFESFAKFCINNIDWFLAMEDNNIIHYEYSGIKIGDTFKFKGEDVIVSYDCKNNMVSLISINNGMSITSFYFDTYKIKKNINDETFLWDLFDISEDEYDQLPTILENILLTKNKRIVLNDKYSK